MSRSAVAEISTRYFFCTLEFLEKILHGSRSSGINILFRLSKKLGKVCKLQMPFISRRVEDHNIRFAIRSYNQWTARFVNMCSNRSQIVIQFGNRADVLNQ